MHRIRRHYHLQHEHQSPPGFVGILFLTIGVLFLLQTFGIIQIRQVIGQLWPTVIIAWGASRLLARQGGWALGVAAMVVGSLLLLNRLLGWEFNAWGLIWSAVFIGMGSHILLRSWRRSGSMLGAGLPPGTPDVVVDGETVPPIPPEGGDSASSTLREVAILGSVERRNTSQIFRGGHVTAMMGSADIDLSGTRMADAQTTIDVDTVMGSIVFTIPKDWALESRASVFMGSLEDRSRPPEVPGKKLVIDGDIVMGTVEVRN